MKKDGGKEGLDFKISKPRAKKNPKTEYSSGERQSLQNIIVKGIIQATGKAIPKIDGFCSSLAHGYKENRLQYWAQVVITNILL